MKKNAFTLVEMLVVIALLSIFGILILTIFTRSLRGGNKSQIIGIIKQNGQSVLEQMDKTIRNADNVVCLSNDNPSTTLIVVQKGIYTRYRFILPSPPPPAVPTVNGLIQQDNPSKQPVAGSNPPREETDSELKNRICAVANQMSQPPTILTDTNPTTGVSVENGSFTPDKSAGFRDQITIKFNLNPGVEAPEVIRGQIDAVSFQTTIQLR